MPYTGTTTGSVGVLFATQAASLPGYNVPGKVIFSGGTIAVQVGGGGWTALEVEALVTNATKNSGALGIDTTTGSLVQSASFTAGTFGSNLGLNKLGSNDLTLDQATTYTGTTTVTAGTLTLANPLALQNSPLNISGGSVVLSGLTTLTLGGLSGSGALDVTSLTNLTLNAPAGALLNYSGIIADGTLGMTVTKTGPGAQALTGANTYTGATQIDGGILTFGNKAAKTAATATAAAAGSIGLGVHPADAAFYSATDVDALFNNNALTGFVLDPASGVAIDTTNAGGSFDQTVALTASRSLSKTGTGTLVLSQVNSHAGSTNVLQGTLSLTGSLTGGGAVSTSGAGALSQTSTGVISGASTFTQGSTGTSSLAGINTYTGVTNVNLGQLTISHADALGTTAGNTIVASGGRLAMATASLSVAEPLNITGTGSTATNGAIAFGGGVTGMALTGPITLGGAARIQADGNTGSTLSGGISLGANVLTINADGGATQTIDTTAITGTGGSLVKSGSGTLVLGVANSYTGVTTLSGGTLSIGSIANIGAASPIGAGDNTSPASNTASFVFNGGTLAFTGTTGTTDRGFTMTGNGTISFPAGNNNALTFSGNLTGAGTLTLNGASTVGLQNVLTLSGSNADFTGNVTASIGGIKITNNTGLGSGTKTITLSNGTNGNSNIQLDGSGGDITLPSTFTYVVSNNNSGSIVNVAGNNTVAGQIDNTGGGGGFKANSLGGNLTISANYTATTTLRAVVLDGPSNGTVSGIISNGLTVNLPVTKSGSGTWTLSGVNTYTGATTVSAGTLAMGASDVLADSSAVSIGNATLDAATFTDTVGTLDVTSTASINLGTGAALAFADSSAVDWTLPTAGTLNITGTFVSGSSLRFGTTSSGLTPAQLAVISVNGAGAGTYTLNASGYLILPAGGYTSWAAINAIGSNPDQDKDGDGVNNAAEYVLGGTVTTNDLSKLPAASISDSNLLFTFNRSQASIDGSTVVTIEVGTTLLAWPDSYSVPGPAQANVPGVTIVKDTSVGFDTVTLSVPMGTDPKKFARLKTVVTP